MQEDEEDQQDGCDDVYNNYCDVECGYEILLGDLVAECSTGMCLTPVTEQAQISGDRFPSKGDSKRLSLPLCLLCPCAEGASLAESGSPVEPSR